MELQTRDLSRIEFKTAHTVHEYSLDIICTKRLRLGVLFAITPNVKIRSF